MLTKVPDDVLCLGMTLITGSRVVCNPPVEDTDLDVVLYMPNTTPEHTDHILRNLGFRSYGDYHPTEGNMFQSYRREHVNVIAVYSHTHFMAFDYATDVAAFLNVQAKEDRITLFNLIQKYY